MFRITTKSLRHAPANLVRHFSHDTRGSLERVNSGHLKTGVGACFRWNSKGGSIKQLERVSNSVMALSAGDVRRKYSSSTLKLGTVEFSHKWNVSLWMHPRRRYSSNADLPPHQEIGMPSLSPTMTEGNIARWIKKEGDKVSQGEVLCEVETDKATVEMECMEDGYLAKIIRGDGSQGIKVGEVIAVTVEEEEFVQSLKDYTPTSGTADSETKQASESPAPKNQSAETIKQSPEPTKQASNADLPPHQEIGMPSLSPTMTEGNIGRWIKKEGDKVSPGEVLCEVETDKATVEMECMEDGYLAKIIRGDGSQGIKVGELIAITVEEEEFIQKFKDYTPALETAAPENKKPSEPAAPKKQSSEPLNQTEPDMLKSSERSPGDRTSAGPPAKKVAHDHNAVEGSGSNYSDIPHSQIRKVTASRLLMSKQTIPHYYLTVDTCVDNLMELRSLLNLSLEASGGKRISVNDLVIKAAALALKKVPECNSSWTEESIRQYHNVNINVAVQTENGLYVPVIRDADKKGLSEISEEVKLLAQRARDNSLKPEDYEGGTFTVSNLGGPFGIKQFCAIVNPPQAAILAIGTAEKRATPGTGTDQLKFASFMPVSLSCDHRVIDGAIGAQWLKAFKGFIENPKSMML